MRIKENFILREVAGTYLVVAVGDAVKEYNAMINLNETGAFLWKELSNGATEDELVSAMTKNYEVSEQIARRDVLGFLQKLKEARLLQ